MATKNNSSRSCSLVITSDSGKIVYGTAAMLVQIKRAGGFDAFCQKIVNMSTQIAAEQTMKIVADTPPLRQQNRR